MTDFNAKLGYRDWNAVVREHAMLCGALSALTWEMEHNDRRERIEHMVNSSERLIYDVMESVEYEEIVKDD